jgi:hypothetical protein
VHIEFEMKTAPGARQSAGARRCRPRGAGAGPLVYCLEQPDQPGFSLFDASLLDDGSALSSEFKPDLLGGVLVLKHRGSVVDHPFSGEPLYRPFRERVERPGNVVPADVHSLLCVGQSRAIPHGGLGALRDGRERVTAEPAKRRFQVRGLEDQRARHDRVRAGGVQLGDSVGADAAVGHQAHTALRMLAQQTARLA